MRRAGSKAGGVPLVKYLPSQVGDVTFPTLQEFLWTGRAAQRGAGALSLPCLSSGTLSPGHRGHFWGTECAHLDMEFQNLGGWKRPPGSSSPTCA